MKCENCPHAEQAHTIALLSNYACVTYAMVNSKTVANELGGMVIRL